MVAQLDLPEAIIIPANLPEAIVIQRHGPQPAPRVVDRPLSAAELVEIKCYPTNLAVGEAWDKCVAAARLATGHTLTALAYAKSAVRHIDLARQHLILARISATAPWVAGAFAGAGADQNG